VRIELTQGSVSLPHNGFEDRTPHQRRSVPTCRFYTDAGINAGLKFLCKGTSSPINFAWSASNLSRQAVRIAYNQSLLKFIYNNFPWTAIFVEIRVKGMSIRRARGGTADPATGERSPQEGDCGRLTPESLKKG